MKSVVALLAYLTVLLLATACNRVYKVDVPLQHCLRGQTVHLEVRGKQSWIALEKSRIKYARWVKPIVAEKLEQRGVKLASEPSDETPTLDIELVEFDQGRFGNDGLCELDVHLWAPGTSVDATDKGEPLLAMSVRETAVSRANAQRTRVEGRRALVRCAERVADYVVGELD